MMETNLSSLLPGATPLPSLERFMLHSILHPEMSQDHDKILQDNLLMCSQIREKTELRKGVFQLTKLTSFERTCQTLQRKNINIF